MEPLNEIPRQITRIEITKQARLESILYRYHWTKKPSHSKAYSHLFLPNLEISIRGENEIQFRIVETQYFFTSDYESLEQVLEYIDSNWRAIQKLQTISSLSDSTPGIKNSNRILEVAV